jgi:hypothetical protein
MLTPLLKSWGISVGASILQNELQRRLPSSLLSTIPQGEDYAYNLIPLIPTFEPTLQAEVRLAFSDSLRVVWRVFLIFSGVGMASMALMKELPLSTETNRDRGIESSSSSSEGHEEGPVMGEPRLEGGSEQGQGSLLHVPKRPWDTETPEERPSTSTSQRTLASQATDLTNPSVLEEGGGGGGGKEAQLKVVQVPGKVSGKCKMKRPSTGWSTNTMVAVDEAMVRGMVETEGNDMTTEKNDMTEKTNS